MPSITSTTGLPVCNSSLEFVEYFPRQLLTAEDMRAADRYFREKLRRHNRMLHGWGVVCGGQVTAGSSGWKVTVGPTYAITPAGDEVCIPEEIIFDLTEGTPQAYDPCLQTWPCSPAGATKPTAGNRVYLAVCYAECSTRPVRVQPAGCGCEDTACEYSRVRESYELVLLEDLPKSHKDADQADQDWQTKKTKSGSTSPAPTPDCPPPTEDSCVVLCSITLPGGRSTPITSVDSSVRRILHGRMV